MSLFFAATIATMALGHLLAVTVKALQGTLAGGLPLLYGIGVFLLAPAAALAVHAVSLPDVAEPRAARRTLVLNAGLGLVLLALGPRNLPLAAPAVLNVAYQLHARRWLGHTIVALAVVAQVALFAGALAFLASGRSFEEFRGID
jgi:hypothetical protein